MHELSTVRWMKLNMKPMWLVRQGWTETVTHCSRNGRKEAMSSHEVIPPVRSGPFQKPGSAGTSCRGLKVCQAPTSSVSGFSCSSASFVRELNAIRYHWTLTESTLTIRWSWNNQECERKRKQPENVINVYSRKQAARIRKVPILWHDRELWEWVCDGSQNFSHPFYPTLYVHSAHLYVSLEQWYTTMCIDIFKSGRNSNDDKVKFSKPKQWLISITKEILSLINGICWLTIPPDLLQITMMTDSTKKMSYGKALSETIIISKQKMVSSSPFGQLGLEGFENHTWLYVVWHLRLDGLGPRRSRGCQAY